MSGPAEDSLEGPQSDRPEATPTKRRVGRPSRAKERRAQILDAVEECIVEYGIERTTMGKVADVAGVPRSLIHHYLGNREALLQVAAARAVANVDRTLRQGLAESEGGDVIERLLDILFGPRMRDRRITHLIDELGAASLRDAGVRQLLADMYDSFVSDFERRLAKSFPDVPAEQRRDVAHAVVVLVESSSRFADYGFDPDNYRRARRIAARLIADLGDPE